MERNERVEWTREQHKIANQASLKNDLPPLEQINTIAGADVSTTKFSNLGFAGIVVLSYPELETIEMASAVAELEVPYIPTFLSYREWPLLKMCIEQLQTTPDVLICDGQGIAHPRRAGIATHVGVLTGWITIGCGKTRLCGEHQEPKNIKASTTDLIYRGEKIGEVLRSKPGSNPLFISPGHRIDFTHATGLILELCGKYRQPEPIRRAHSFVNQLRRDHFAI